MRNKYLVSRLQASAILQREAASGRIFSATFFKKNGELRVANCRKFVKSELKGGTLKYDAKSRGLMSAVDNNKRLRGERPWIMVNLHALVSFRCRGMDFEII